jgi:hypothetical protein
MINCRYLNYNENIVFNTIAEEKNDPAWSALRPAGLRVGNAYNSYLQHFQLIQSKHRSDFVPPVDDNVIDALKSCYDSPTQSFKIIKGKIFAVQPGRLKDLCPYCLLDRPRTLDHYVAKADFPEYSVLIKNLIPCCYDCNQKKDDDWRNNRLRRFIHFYTDQFLHHSFLHAKLIYPRGSRIPRILFSLTQPHGMAAADFRIVKMHFKDLKLLYAYNTRANQMVSSEIEVMRQGLLRGNSKAHLVAGLLDRANAEEAALGVNYWNAILYRTIANNTRLISSL